MKLEEFYLSAEQMHRKVVEAADRGELFLSDELRTLKVQEWVEDGAGNLGLFHDAEVVRIHAIRAPMPIVRHLQPPAC